MNCASLGMSSAEFLLHEEISSYPKPHQLDLNQCFGSVSFSQLFHYAMIMLKLDSIDLVGLCSVDCSQVQIDSIEFSWPFHQSADYFYSLIFLD